MAFDAHINFGYTTVATPPAPASSGTTLTLAAGAGALLPPAPFNATVWPAGQLALTTNAEIVRVTARTGDVLTLVRAAEPPSLARAILPGDQFAVTITAKTLQDVEDAFGTLPPALHALTHIGTGTDPLPHVDLPEAAPTSPPANYARLFALDVNAYTQVEMRDSAGRGVRFASDNILIAKITEPTGVARGQVVYIAGAAGANALVRLARANDINTMPGIGLVLDAGAMNAFTRVLVTGTLQQMNTAAFVEGVSLFVSPTTAGALTDVLPIAPDFAQRIGFVTRSHATVGETLVLTTGVVTPPRLHHTTHEPGGTDPLAALDAGILTSGTLPDARLSANVARKNVDNVFVAQHIAAGSWFHGQNGPLLYLQDTGAGLNAKVWRILQYNDGLLRFEPLTDDLTTAQALVYFRRDGSVGLSGSIVASGDLVEKGRLTPLGHWQDVPFNPANFSANGGTWTVGAAAIISNRYTLIGKTLIWAFYISWFSGSNTLSGAPGAVLALYISLPAGLVAATSNSSPVAFLVDGASGAVGNQAHFSASGSLLSCAKLGGGAFTPGAMGLIGSVTIEIQ